MQGFTFNILQSIGRYPPFQVRAQNHKIKVWSTRVSVTQSERLLSEIIRSKHKTSSMYLQNKAQEIETSVTFLNWYTTGLNGKF